MKIKRVALLGAGAVGSYIIWGLSKKPEISFSVLADGARKDRLERDGVRINGTEYNPSICDPSADLSEEEKPDLLIVALKYGALSGAMESIRNATGPHTVVMSLMNGVDSEEKIAAVVGEEHLLYSMIKIASHRDADGVHFNPEATVGIIFGEKRAPFDSDRVNAVKELFQGTGVNIRSTDIIQEEIWGKFRLNICNNLPQAILGVGVGCYRDSVHMQAIFEGLRREVETVALAKGIDLSKLPESSTKGCPVSSSARYSTLQDLDAKRPTEIDMFSGAMIRMGKELNIPVPYNEYTYHMIKAMEEKNQGKFNYDENSPMSYAR